MAVKLRTPLYIDINVYSNALNLSGSCCDKIPNDSSSTADFTSVTFVPSRIGLPVFDHTVNTDGYLAKLNVTMSERNDFGNYYITFANEIGKTKAWIAIVERGTAIRYFTKEISFCKLIVYNGTREVLFTNIQLNILPSWYYNSLIY